MSVAIGSKLAQFDILAKLGEGAMGEVFRARDTELGREVAIELLPADMAAGPNQLDRFPREPKSVAALDHPGVVTLYRVQQDPGFFLVLEPIEGKSLDQILLPAGLGRDRIFELAIPIAVRRCLEKDPERRGKGDLELYPGLLAA